MQTIESYSDSISFCKTKGYTKITDLQEKAFRNEQFYDSKKDLFVIGETSSGKTLIAQLAIAMNNYGKTLFIVPYRALVKQKMDELGKFFDDKEVVISTSEYRENDSRIISGQVDIVVIIYEKVFLFAALNPKIFAQYDTIVFDEFGLIDDEERGVKADLMFSWVRKFSNIRTVVLATPTFDWSLYADKKKFLVINSSVRPVPLNKVDVIRYKGKRFIELRGDAPIPFNAISGTICDILEHICLEHRKLGHKILVFDNDRTGVQKKAEFVYGKFLEQGFLTKPTPGNIENFKHKILERMDMREEDLFLAFTDSDFEMMLCGISFHSGGLPLELRFEIENEFLNDSGKLFIVFATETLAFGLNSGVDVVVVANLAKPRIAEMTHIKSLISKNEYMNYIGRAGRLGYQRDQGYAYTIISNKDIGIWDEILKSNIEVIESKLFSNPPNKSAMYLLSVIPDSPNSITIEQIKNELSYLLKNANHDLNDTHKCFLNSINDQCEMLENRALIRQDDSTFGTSYQLTDKGRKLQGYIIDINTYDTLIQMPKKFIGKQVNYFDYCYEISQCRRLIENNGTFFTKSATNDYMKLLSNYFKNGLESDIVKNKHTSQELSEEIREKYRFYDEHGNLKPGKVSNEDKTRLRIATILYLRLLGSSVEKIGKTCVVGYAASKRLGEQASYLTDIVCAIAKEKNCSKMTDDKLNMLSLSLFYCVHVNALGLCDINSISAENYRHIKLLTLCVEFAEKINHSQNDPKILLYKRRLKDRFQALPEQLQSVFTKGYGGSLL
jgi:replicative superfamily II helicase